jgi:hypothetical protein
MTNWYSLKNETESITQGDLISCPVVRWKDGKLAIKKTPKSTLLNSREIKSVNAVILSQACDLANNKITNVILCRRLDLSFYKNAWQTARKAANATSNVEKEFQTHLSNIQRGYAWGQCLLNSFESDEIVIEHQVVDFGEIFSLPRVFLDDYVTNFAKTRLTLNSPYREHLSQGFARFFMRVGLPTDVHNIPK